MAKMKVLIVDCDLFKSVGGGQTFYRSVIEKNPHIVFYYFIKTEPLKFSRPANAKPISYKEGFFNNDFKQASPELLAWLDPVITASNFALSVGGHQFDIVDLPDYTCIGCMIYPAFKRFGISFGRLAISMHGLISKAIMLNWGSVGNKSQVLDLFEKMQYQTADLRYAISRSYIDEWRAVTGIEAYYLDPLSVFAMPKPLSATASAGPPDINFIGRTEKQKGPDIFIEIAWWFSRSSYGRASVIGPDVDVNGTPSSSFLKAMAGYRIPGLQILPGMSREKLSQVYAGRSMTILPSRSDTFGLVAFESLFSGCPTAIGSVAGICRFLDEEFPKVPYVKIDINDIYGAALEIESVLKDYDNYRRRLYETLVAARPSSEGETLEEIYGSASSFDAAAREELECLYSKIIGSGTTGLIKKIIPKRFHKRLSEQRAKLNKDYVAGALKARAASRWPAAAAMANQYLLARSYNERYKIILSSPENNKNNIAEKIKALWEFGVSTKLDRIRVLREVARLEGLLGNDLVSAAYRLRSMRLLCEDRFKDLPSVAATFERNGFSREAQVATLMYSDNPGVVENSLNYLEQAFQANRNNPAGLDFEFVDDRRGSSPRKVSVIVSLYNAASKLPRFLKALRNQTMVRDGMVELVFIDSGSPSGEYAVFKECIQHAGIPAVYARSKNRETIQRAWNRGLLLARSPYITCLGVDEAILPDCLAVLSAELDRDASIDWVQSNTLVTDVDKNGLWVKDVMPYDRTGYKQSLVYLDTCYLNWVGGLYRRSIHERFGYYDSSFTAAGDTEFKLRILPYIKSKFVPKMLGVFLNYPEERTTQHPRAEIEDLRAWYLHRTKAGVMYAFGKKDPSEAEDLLYTALCFRKSFCTHMSTDLEYAFNLASFLEEKHPQSPALKYMGGIKDMLQWYRTLDFAENPTKTALLALLQNGNKKASKIEKSHRAVNEALRYGIFNDNRYEQHTNLWEARV